MDTNKKNKIEKATMKIIRHITVLITAVLLLCCCKNNGTVIDPTEANLSFSSGYAVFYGDYYNYLNIQNNVLGLSLLSPRLSIDSAGYYVGSGTHLILTDIFVNPADTLLPVGHYTVSDEGTAMTFLDGYDFDGNILGAYMLLISESGYKIDVLKNGYFDVEYSKDTTIIDFHFTRSNGKTYSPTFKGILPTYISINATDN